MINGAVFKIFWQFSFLQSSILIGLVFNLLKQSWHRFSWFELMNLTNFSLLLYLVVMKRLAIIFLLFINALLLSALTPADSAVIRSSVVSYKMVNLKSGEVVADVNSSMAATPASVTKLITTATALELLLKIKLYLLGLIKVSLCCLQLVV